MAIEPRAALVALAGVLIALLAPLGALPADLALVALILADVILAGAPRQLAIDRGRTGAVRLGESTTVELALTNLGRRRARGRLRDGWVPSAGAHPRVVRFDVPAGQVRRVSITLVPSRRGTRRSARITVRSLGPLGLAGRQGHRGLAGAVTVLPPFASRRLLPAKFAQLRRVEGLVAVRGAGRGSEVDSLRDYVDGDDARTVDWRASARHAGIVVRSYRPERDRRITLVLDTGRTSAARIGDAPRLDHALDATLLLAAVARRAGDRVDLVAYDRTLRADVRSGSGKVDLLARLITAMTPLEPALVETDYRALVGQLLRRPGQRSLIVLFTDLAPVIVQESLVPLLGPLTSRHRVLVAAVRHPALDGVPATFDLGSVYQAAALTRAALDRDGAAANLRQRGVSVVDAAPGVFASAVTDVYLHLKAMGQL